MAAVLSSSQHDRPSNRACDASQVDPDLQTLDDALDMFRPWLSRAVAPSLHRHTLHVDSTGDSRHGAVSVVDVEVVAHGDE
jgi:hypothetical protein